MSVAIVVLSRFNDIFQQFKASAEKHESDTRKVLVRDGNEIESPNGWLTIQGEEPFCFAVNANLGIQSAGGDDVLLVNDDVGFLQPHTSVQLSEIAHADASIGILSPQIVGAAMNLLQNDGYRLSPDPQLSTCAVAFVCIYIKRSTLHRVGLLDERFKNASFEDNDYFMRVKKVGLETAVTSQVTVRHGFGAGQGTTSIKRRYGGYAKISPGNRKIFVEKWS